MKKYQIHSSFYHIHQNKKDIFYLCYNIILIKHKANPILNMLDVHIMSWNELIKRMLIMEQSKR